MVLLLRNHQDVSDEECTTQGLGAAEGSETEEQDHPFHGEQSTESPECSHEGHLGVC